MDIKNLVLTEEAQSLVDNGAWVKDIPGAGDVELLVIGWNSNEVQRAIELEQIKARADLKGEPLDSTALAAITCEVLHSVALKDWRGITDDGEEVKYTPELAEKFIASPNGERFASIVLAASQRLSDRVNDFVESALKN